MKRALMGLGTALVMSVALATDVYAQSGVAGTWVTTDFNNLPNLIALQVQGTRVTGTISRNQEVFTIYDGSVAGNVVTFKATDGPGDRTITFRGTLSGNTMAFTRSVEVRPGGGLGGAGIVGGMPTAPAQFTASRDNAGGATVPHALFGNWKVNMARSTFDPGPAPSPNVPDHVNVVARPGGDLSYLLVGVTVGGSPIINVASLRADGRDYPRHSQATLAALLDSSTPTTLTTSLRAIDARTFEWTNKTNGTVTQTLRWTVSADGNSITDVVRNVDTQGQVTSTNTYLLERIRPAAASR